MSLQSDPLPPTSIRVPKEHAGLRADDFLALALKELSRTRIRQKIQMGESLLNGRRYASSARLREGDVITMSWRGSGIGAAHEASGGPAFRILFEDGYILAVEKPAGAAVHPVGSIQSGTLIQFVRKLLRDSTEEALLKGDSDPYPNLVNRLDMFTSGIVLVAKDRPALRLMHLLAATGGIHKRYVAVVEGLVEGESGSIELPIGPDRTSVVRLKMAVVQGGLPSATDYRVERRLPGATLITARPRTGRQHQIRVHMAAIGHPVWGDLLYKDEGLFLAYRERAKEPSAAEGSPSLPPRHLLHAAAVSFIHPVTGRRVEVECPLPTDFLEIVADLEKGKHE